MAVRPMPYRCPGTARSVVGMRVAAASFPSLNVMRRTDVALAVGTAVVVSAAALAGVSSQRTPGPGTFVFAAGFGALLLLRRRWPVQLVMIAYESGLVRPGG